MSEREIDLADLELFIRPRRRRGTASHGTSTKYQSGCRCAPCTAANTDKHRYCVARGAWRRDFALLRAGIADTETPRADD